MRERTHCKLALLSAIIVSTVFCNSALAESIQTIDSSGANTQESNEQNIQPTSAITAPEEIKSIDFKKPSNTTTSVQQDTETAVLQNITDEQQKKNIIPVLELKGGVKQTEETTKPPSALKSWLNGDYATGDWRGFRTGLEDHGIYVNGSYLSGSFQKLYGGYTKKRPFRSYGLVDTNLEVDTQKLGLWPGGVAFTRFQNKHGQGLSRDFIGDYQGFEGYDFRTFTQMTEYWYEQSILSDRIKLKLGKQDANSDFSVLDSGFEFVSSSFSFSPNLPISSYPAPAMGALLTLQPKDWIYLKSGWYDGEANNRDSSFRNAFNSNNSSLFVDELNIKHSIKNHPGKAFTGYWLHTKNVDELTNSANTKTYGSNTGFYIGAEQMVIKENKDQNDAQGLTMLGQFAWAPTSRSEIPRYYGIGLVYKGLLPKRNEDTLGIGTSIVGFNRRLKDMADDGRKGHESILEIFYKIKVTNWLFLQPDMQFVFNANGQSKNACVMGVRTFISF